MLGWLRFFLAMFVVFTHLGGAKYLLHWGTFAVFGFYIISGYLMTRILHEIYGFRLAAFATNRFLRLFPTYYIVAVSSALIIFLAPSASEFHSAWNINFRIVDFLGNGLIFPLEFYDASFRLIPTAWSIAVELVNYFFLWLVVGRNPKLAFATMLLALSYHIATFAVGMDYRSRYYPSYAALLPFSLGSCIYFSRGFISGISARIIRFILIFAFLTWVVNLAICSAVSGLGSRYYEIFFYVNLVSLFILVASLTSPWLSSLALKSGKILGDLAYPIFLTHWIVGFCIWSLLSDRQSIGLSLLALSVPFILAISFLLAWLANRWVEPLRNKIRENTVLLK